MSKPLSDRIALVTGASRGIGAALALQLAQAGAHVIAVARTVGGLEELDDKIKAAGGTATLVPLDMKDFDGIARLALALNERYGRLDVLVGNAGILGDAFAARPYRAEGLGQSVRRQRYRQLAFDPHHGPAAQGGAGRTRGIHDIGIELARRAPIADPMPRRKRRSNMLVRTYAAETATTNVRVNVFSPGPTRTRMMRAACPASIRRRCRRRRSSPKKSCRCACRAAARTGGYTISARASSWNSARRRDAGQCLRLARPLNGLSFSRSVRRIGVPGNSKLSRSELTR